MDDELDQMLDGLAEPDAEAAESDNDEAAADAPPDDGQDDDEAAADESDDEASADADAEPEPDDEVGQLRKRLEAVEAERTTQQAQQAAAQQQWQAAQVEAQAAANEDAWDTYFQTLEEQAWADAQETLNPVGAYRAAIAGIIAQRDAKKAEFARYRTGRVETAYHKSQVPTYVQYLTSDLKLGGLDRAQLLELAATDVPPDHIRAFAISLRKRADLQTQERRAVKAATLKKSSGKPGGGGPRRKRVETVDDLVDSLFG